MLAFMVCRSLERAAVDRAQIFKLPDGERSGRDLAENQLRRMGEGQSARFRFTLPYEDGIAEVASPNEKYDFPNEYGSVQLAISGTLVSAGPLQTATF